MRITLQWVFLGAISPLLFGASGFCRELPEPLQEEVDAIVQEAYTAATEGFPCKLKAGGKPKMLRWESVDKCLNQAYESVDWDEVSSRLQEIREKSGLEAVDFLSAVETSMSAHALPYDKVFEVKDEKVLMPLSNSVLKFLPPDSLLNLPVTDKNDKKVGTFAGVYTFEKVGAISGVRQRHYLFQYTDANGKMQSSTDRLLLDTFGVPWKDAAAQTGFRLPVDNLDLGHAEEQRRALTPKIPRKSNEQKPADYR